MVTVFRHQEIGEIYINGVKQTLTNFLGSFDSNNTDFGSQFNVFGWGSSSGYKDFGCIDRLRLFNRELTESEVNILSQSEIDYIKTIKEI